MDDASRIDTDLTLVDACALSDAIRARKVSCVEVMTAFLDRIERLNPTVNAIVSLQDRGRSLAQARERDDELSRGEHRGWMHGFPQAIKDLAPAAGIPLTKGSPLFGEMSKEDGIFVARMRRAGAIVIGKTNTPEFGLGSQTYNPVFGPTLNAYDQAKTAGGIERRRRRRARAPHAARRRRQRPWRLAAQPGGVQQRVRLSPVLRARAGERRGGVPAAALRSRGRWRAPSRTLPACSR